MISVNRKRLGTTNALEFLNLVPNKIVTLAS